jgi:nucleotide-binding universal stress UspA family protein
MFRTVTAGIDGSRESLAAAEWAAREARLRALPLRLVNVWEPVPEPMGREPVLGVATGPDDSGESGVGRVLREAADGIRLRHPGLDPGVEQLTGRASEELLRVAHEGDLLVLGSRGLSGPRTSTRRAPPARRRPWRRSGPSCSDWTPYSPTTP